MFKINRITDYAVVILNTMCHKDVGTLFSAADLAERTAIPLPTVSKTLKLLAKGGILKSHRGVSGGYAITRPPREITIAQILQAIEGPLALTACVEESEDDCDAKNYCPLSGQWETMNQGIADVLNSVTMEDMAKPIF